MDDRVRTAGSVLGLLALDLLDDAVDGRRRPHVELLAAGAIGHGTQLLRLCGREDRRRGQAVDAHLGLDGDIGGFIELEQGIAGEHVVGGEDDRAGTILVLAVEVVDAADQSVADERGAADVRWGGRPRIVGAFRPPCAEPVLGFGEEVLHHVVVVGEWNAETAVALKTVMPMRSPSKRSTVPDTPRAGRRRSRAWIRTRRGRA